MNDLDDPLASALPDLLERAVPDRRPPVHPLVTGGLARGYRRRRLRRAGQVAGIAAAVVALALPVGLVANAVRDRPVVAQPAASTQASPAPAPSRALVDTQQGVTAALVSLLSPKGTVTWPQSNPVNGHGVGVSVQFDDGHGLALVTATVWSSLVISGPPSAPGPEWTTTTLPDGSIVQGRLEHVTPVDPTEAFTTAVLIRPDGTGVSMQAWNAPAAKSTDVTRAQPPFTVAQLMEMVQAPVWLAG